MIGFGPYIELKQTAPSRNAIDPDEVGPLRGRLFFDRKNEQTEKAPFGAFLLFF